MSANGKYQEFEPLSPEEFAALERSILDRGVEVPIIFDEAGSVIDGHHRLKICKKHNITNYPTIVRGGLSDDEKRDLAQSLNMARRSLSREQRQEQIRNRLKRNPGQSDRLIAQALGVDHKTVGRIRAEMVTGGDVPHVDRKVGRNGMPYTPPPKPKMIDSEGGEIPQHLESVFALRPEQVSVLNGVIEAKRRLLDFANRSSLHTRLSALKRHFDSVEATLRETLPHAVHRPCDGVGCDACGGKGYHTGGEIPQVAGPVGHVGPPVT